MSELKQADFTTKLASSVARGSRLQGLVIKVLGVLSALVMWNSLGWALEATALLVARHGASGSATAEWTLHFWTKSAPVFWAWFVVVPLFGLIQYFSEKLGSAKGDSSEPS